MKRNFDVPVTDIGGVPIDVRVSDVVKDALLSNLPGDESHDAKMKFKLVDIATRVHEGGMREYATDELEIIKNRCLRVATTLTYVQIHKLIETDPATVE